MKLVWSGTYIDASVDPSWKVLFECSVITFNQTDSFRKKKHNAVGCFESEECHALLKVGAEDKDGGI